MAWTIKVTRTAEKQIAKLDRAAQKRITRFLRERVLCAENPRQTGKALRGSKATLWRYRVGDYRLICDVQDEMLTILLLEVGHRKEVYR